ncbi:hypothetical protein MVEN_00190600 [Mycena venus]|uniref:BTB domain-containing protein n=1 Tax=Mycena venus TaxID=2733690 RepID=A0A8H6YY76_9AGAR|nr:hypothetical protein MVEN_00190600 [Mycena venus]
MQPIKRQRTESESEGGQPVRSDIWFDDGNIIVQAEDTQFRVYRGTLCSTSEVFKDTISNMIEAKGIEGCPILFLSDYAADVTYIFRTIFYRWSYQDHEPLPFGAISAFLRLGRKYEMKPLFDGALRRLTAVFPQSIEQYASGNMNKNIVFDNPEAPDRRSEIVIDTIVLARTLELPFLLPSAFWFASTNILSIGTKNIGAISEGDRVTIFSAVNPLRVAYADYLFDWLDETKVEAAGCSLPQTCGPTKVSHSLNFWKPPGSALVLSWRPAAAQGLCRSCAGLGKKRYGEGAKRLWKELPSFFGLPAWEELLAGAPNV